MRTALHESLLQAGRLLPLAVLGWLPLSQAQAQTLNYTTANAQNVSGTYTDLGTVGTVITTTSTDDANSAAQPIGFSFRFNGGTFTDFVLNTNGIIRLGSAAPSVAALYANFETGQTQGTDPIANTSPANTNLVAPFNCDLIAGTAAGGAEYRVATTGTAPNRVCTIQWKNVSDKAGTRATQFASFAFQAKLYETTNNIEFVYGPAVITTAGDDVPRFSTVGLKGSSSANLSTVLVNRPLSADPWSSAVFITGVYGTTTHNFRRTVPADPGRTYRFRPTVLPANDVAVNNVFSLGQVAQSAGPHTASAQITNNSAGTLTNIPVTLAVTGANTATNVQTIPSLASGASVIVNFAPYALTNLGVNTLTVTVPNDDVNTNNSRSYSQNVTTSRMSYIEANQPFISTGIGVSAVNSALAVRYTVPTATVVSRITPTFQGAGTAGTTYQVQLYTATAGPNSEPGTVLFTSPTLTRPAVTGPVNIVVPNISIPAGDFFVVLRSLTANNVGLAYQVEDPLRPSTFYFQGSATDPWTLINTQTIRARLALEAGLNETCPFITGLTVANVTNTGANVTFTPATGATSYTVTYTAAGGQPVSVTPAPTGSPVALTGLTPGTTYTVSVTANCSATQSSIPVTTTFTTTFPVPANDLCANAIPLACGATITGTTNGATTTGDPTLTCGPTVSASPGVFYRLIGNGQTVTVSTCSGPTATAGDTKVMVYSGTCGTFTCVGGSDDTGATNCSGNSEASRVTFTSAPGVPYFVFVQFFSAGATGNFGLTATCTGTISAARNQIGAGELNVFPNPASQNLTVSLPAIAGQRTAQVTLLNTLGQQVQTRTLSLQAAGTETRLDVSKLAKGLYTLRVQTGSQMATKQVVVE